MTEYSNSAYLYHGDVPLLWRAEYIDDPNDYEYKTVWYYYEELARNCFSVEGLRKEGWKLCQIPRVVADGDTYYIMRRKL